MASYAGRMPCVYVGNAVSRTRWYESKPVTLSPVQPVLASAFAESTFTSETVFPTFCAAATQACAAVSVAAAGALPSPAEEEET